MAENIFEKRDENGEVIQRIVIAPEVLALGYWGNPDDWTQVESEDDGEL